MWPGTEPELIFADGEVLFYYQPVGLIVAESFEIANHAADFVEVTYKSNGKAFKLFINFN